MSAKAWYLVLIFAVLQVGCSSLLYYPTHGIYYDPARFGKTAEDVHFQSADGTKLHGWFFAHTNKGKAKALLVFYHGNGENLSSHYVVLLPFLEKGYDFFIFDYRGYGQSEGEPSPKGTVADGEAALRWAKNRAANTPLVLFAQSLGSVVALRNAIDLKSEIPYRYVIIDSGFQSYQTAARRILAKGWLTWPFQWLAYLVLSDRYAPEDEVSKISPTPILIVHGTADQIIDYKNGQELFAAAGEPKDFWSVEGGTHTTAFVKSDTYRKRLLELLDKNFPLPNKKALAK